MDLFLNAPLLLCCSGHYVIYGVESWSGVLEWSHGVTFWSEVYEWTGMMSDFELFALPPFLIIFKVYAVNIK